MRLGVCGRKLLPELEVSQRLRDVIRLRVAKGEQMLELRIGFFRDGSQEEALRSAGVLSLEVKLTETKQRFDVMWIEL
jgi:hypothetical protein